MTTPTIERPAIACGDCGHGWHSRRCTRFGCKCTRFMPPEGYLPMPRMEESRVRLVRMVRFFEAGGTAGSLELAQRFGVSTRTIQRDIQLIERRCLPIAVVGTESHPRYRMQRFDGGK